MPSARPHLATGTSGFAYKAWKGAFYPEDLPDREMLPFYSRRLRAVEINNTFYRLPKPEVLTAWAAATPDGFRFALKASRRITHLRRLKDVEEPTSYLLETVGALGDRLGPVLFQLPPYLKRDDERLRALLGLVPPGRQVALEFRHPSWLVEPVMELLREHGAALVLVDGDEPGLLAREVTASWGYLRLRREAYGEQELADWAEWIAGSPWREAFVFFKHEDAGAGPRLAADLERVYAELRADGSVR